MNPFPVDAKVSIAYYSFSSILPYIPEFFTIGTDLPA
jgi:hypothetical protein